MALQFRRGTDSDRLTITPTAGEPIWTTDTEKLYIGDGSTAGGIAVGNDSAEINVIIQNKLGNVSGNIVPDTDSAYDLGSPTNKFKDLYLSGNSIYLGDNLILRNDAGTLVAEDSSATPVSISLTSNTTSDLAEGTNLYYTTARADSDAKNAISASGDLTYNSATGAFSVTTYKSADFNTDLGTKTTADLTEGSNLYFTNARADARVTATADSAYVQARQIKYTNADFTDSAFVTTQINNLIDAAPGALDTLNELAAAIGDDANFSTTITNQIAGKLDSAQTTALIDSAYVQARQTTYDFLDSSEAIALIDSAYVQLRQVDPVSAFGTIAVSGQSDVVAEEQSGGVTWSSGSQQALFQSSDIAADDDFGFSVDISEDGNYAVVGARGDNTNEGAAYIFTRSGSTWSQQAKLEASDGSASDQFGFCVGIDADGDTVVVGAPSGGNAAYVFTRSGSTWSQQQIISAPSDDATVTSTVRFGHGAYISDDGDSVFILSRGTKSSIAQHIGYVYTRSGSTWSQQDRLITSDAGSGDTEMDGAFSGDASTAVICSPGHDWGGSYGNAGAVYVFKKSVSTWSQEAKIEKSSKTANDFFGYGTDISQDGNTLVVGAYKLDTSYIFTRSGSTWSQQASITGTDTTSGDQFGRSTHISNDGNYVAVSASYEDAAATDAGALYVFERSGSTWSQQIKLTASDAEQDDLIGIFENGISLSGDGTTLIAGAYFEDTGGTSAGKAYVFTAPGGAASLNDTLTLEAGSGITITTNASTDTITIGTSGLDSSGVTGLVDSAYVQARQSGLDLSAVSQHIVPATDSTYDLGDSASKWRDLYLSGQTIVLGNLRLQEQNGKFKVSNRGNGNRVSIDAENVATNLIDSSQVISLIDSAYVQARQTTYTNADFADSAFVTTQINNLIDAAPGALDTLNELAAAIGDDANFSTTITNQIAGKLDSAQTTALIDSAYVQARQTTGTDSAATISLIQANSVDSAEVISLIDSAYVAARTTAGTDSAAIINLIDSAYVQERQVYSNDILLQIDSDLTTTDSAQIVHSFNKSTYRTVKYTAQLENDATSSYHAEEILLTHDGTNIAISSYSKLTLDSDLGEFDAQITGNNVELTLTPTNANTHVKLRAIAMSEGAANSNGLIIAVDSDLTTTDSAQTIHTFDKTNFRTLKYIAQLAVPSTGDYHAQEILLTHNGTNVAMTGYAKILLDSDLGTFDALINGNNVELKLSPTKANTNVKLRAIRTLA